MRTGGVDIIVRVASDEESWKPSSAPPAGGYHNMPDRLVSVLLKLYPPEFRERFGPQIEADLYHPGSNVVLATLDIVRTALYHRATTPGLYIWIAATILAAAIVAISGTVTLQGAYRILQPGFGTDAELYALLFFAVFIVILSVLLLAIHWLQKCSKSKV